MPSLTSIAQAALQAAKQIDDYLTEHNIAYTSYEEDTLSSLPPEINTHRDTLVNSSHLLRRLALGTDGLYGQILFSFVDELSLRIVYTYDLASLVPLKGTATFSTIANATTLPQTLVERVMRHAMSNGIFTESTPGHVCHSAASRALAEDPELRDAVGMMTCDISPAASKLLDAIEKWPGSGEPDETAFTLQNEPGIAIYDYLAKHPERAKRFGGGMRYYGRAESCDLRWLIQAFPWTNLDRPDAVLVDVGGGHGTVCRALAASTQYMKFIVQDLAGTVNVGRDLLPEGLKNRVQFMEHDFFTEQPIQGADVYFFRWILHNWSSKYCIKILRMLIPALKPGAKIMLYEHVLKDGPETRLTEKRLRDNDLIMLAQFNALERTRAAWEALFQASDPRFKLSPPTSQEGSAFCLIKATWMV